MKTKSNSTDLQAELNSLNLMSHVPLPAGNNELLILGDSFAADGEHEYLVQYKNNKPVRWYVDGISVREEEFKRYSPIKY